MPPQEHGDPLYRHHMNIWTNTVNDTPQCNHLFAHVPTETIQHCHAHPTELTVVPTTKEHPGVLALLHELNPAISMQLCPRESLLQNSRVHTIEDYWLKAKQQWESGMRAYSVTKRATNQNLIPRPHNVHVHLTGNKSKLGPQLMHQFIIPPKRKTSTKEETLARTGRLASTVPLLSAMRSSAKGYSLSLTTRGPLKMRSRWRATSWSRMALPSKSSTRQPGASKRRRWSRGKCFVPC